jgi:hypothetical protein
MSNVKRKSARAVLCLVLAFVVAFTFLLATSAVFADTSTETNQKITGTFQTTGYWKSRILTGEMHIDKSAFTYVKGNGDVAFNVDATDLFNEAYAEYVKNYQKSLFAYYYEHLVMFGQENSYPIFTYTVKFPNNVKVDSAAVSKSADTATIGGISCDNVDDHTLIFTFKLGGWWDYGEFFNHVKQEANDGKAHPIQITIPVSGTISGQVNGAGSCVLYKGGNHSLPDPIINISSNDTWNF